MKDETGTARRYHWLSEGLTSFVDTPHAAIEGETGGNIVNLIDRRAAASRRAQLDLLATLGPDRIASEFSAWEGGRPAHQAWPRPRSQTGGGTPPLLEPAQLSLPHLVMPAHQDVRPSDVIARRLHGSLAAAADRGPSDFAELLLVPGVGARTVEALAMVAEIVHGTPCRFADPARFSFAHGGKDGHPFPVPLNVYDRTIAVMKSAVRNAKLGREEELAALKRLDAQSRTLERHATGPSVEAHIAEERTRSRKYGGRTVFGEAKPPGAQPDAALVGSSNEALPRVGSSPA